MRRWEKWFLSAAGIAGFVLGLYASRHGVWPIVPWMLVTIAVGAFVFIVDWPSLIWRFRRFLKLSKYSSVFRSRVRAWRHAWLLSGQENQRRREDVVKSPPAVDIKVSQPEPESDIGLRMARLMAAATPFVQFFKDVERAHPELTDDERLTPVVVAVCSGNRLQLTAGDFCELAAALSGAVEVHAEPVWDPSHDEDALCQCGHPYYRHFDTYEQMAAIGCKYCECRVFAPSIDPPPERGSDA